MGYSAGHGSLGGAWIRDLIACSGGRGDAVLMSARELRLVSSVPG
jgi:hypothetical protein